ncbi:MAG: replicative DNA helicase [Candidatus Pacebacteria bacterium]|jgi:replicative DNA helicase|nr:replicative DNA helicase [Candidatus Paceibacterota bacterium]
METASKLPPQSIEIEQSLLGCLMLDPSAITKVADILNADDFYRHIHKEIYQVCRELFEMGEPIDFLSVSTRLKDKNLLETIGGSTYLTELVNMVPSGAHASSYARIVRHKRVLRDLISASQDIESLGYNESDDLEEILDEAEKKIFNIAQKGISQNFTAIKDTLPAAFERIEMLSQGKGTRGIPTNYADLDKMLSGLQRSDLVILAARPSLGKSTLALNIAANIAYNEKIPVGVFSLEMSKDQMVDRLISAYSGVDLWKIRTGKLQTEDFEQIQRALGILAETPLYIDDVGSPSVLQMKALSRRLQAENGLGLLVIDYLQLMEPLNKQASPVQQVSENSRALKGLARELNIPVLVLSQLSRAVEQRIPPIPKLSDLRESGAIEQDADVVMFIYREDRYREESTQKGVAEIIIAKHRNGPVGKVLLHFDDRTVCFKNHTEGYEYQDQ